MPNKELNLQQVLLPTQRQEMSPLLRAPGTETLRRMRSFNPAGGESSYQSFVNQYEELVRILLSSGRLAVGAAGPNVTGKGALISQLEQAFYHDPRIKAAFGDAFGVSKIPYSLSDDVAQRLPESDPRHIPRELNPSTYTFAHTQNGSQVQLDLFKKHVLPRFNAGGGEVVLMEGSVLLSTPVNNNYPVRVEGIQDLGTSTLFNLLEMPETAAYTYLFLMYDKSVSRIRVGASEYRKAIQAGDFRRAFTQGREKVVMTVYRGGKPVLMEVKDAPDDVQEALTEFINLTQAPPAAVEKLSNEHRAYLNQLHAEGRITEPTTLAHYTMLEGMFRTNRIVVVDNQFVPNKQTTQNLDYFLQSVPVKEVPELVPAIVRDFIGNLPQAA